MSSTDSTPAKTAGASVVIADAVTILKSLQAVIDKEAVPALDALVPEAETLVLELIPAPFRTTAQSLIGDLLTGALTSVPPFIQYELETWIAIAIKRLKAVH